MENYRRSSHTVYDLKYHLVWITKYRKPVLAGEVALRLRELVREICKGNDVEIMTSLVLLGTIKNYGLAGGLALFLFSKQTAIPATVSTVFMFVHII